MITYQNIERSWDRNVEISSRHERPLIHQEKKNHSERSRIIKFKFEFTGPKTENLTVLFQTYVFSVPKSPKH